MKLICVLLVVLSSLQAVGQNCSAIFSFGLYDIGSAEGSEQQAASFSNWLCSNNAHARSAAQSFGLDYQKLAERLGFNASSSDNAKDVEEICKNSTKNQLFQSAFTRQSQTISSIMVGAYQTCIARKGVHAYLETTFDPRKWCPVFAGSASSTT